MHPLADLLICLRFFSRLPLPATRREIALGSKGFAQALAMVPLAGAVIGLCPALVLAAARAAGVPAAVAAPLAIAALVAVTGALHEDGLADCADGFGGGRTRERKLEIMRDSRIGTFGGCAIALALYLRAATLTAIALHGTGLAVSVLIGAAALSRTLCLLPLALLPPARLDGAGASAGRVDRTRFLLALALAAAMIGAAPLGFGASALRVLAALTVAGLAALAVCGLARRQIGGQSGDVAGAAQQAAEIAVLVVFSGVG